MVVFNNNNINKRHYALNDLVGVDRSTNFLFQKISSLVQRYNDSAK